MKNQLSAIGILSRFRTYTMIDIIGPAISVAATLIVVRYIHQEITIDRFCKDLDRLYLLTIQRSNDSISIADSTDRNNDPNFIDPLKDPEVEAYSCSVSFDDDYVVVDNHRYRANVLVTDGLLLQLMDYPIASGIKTIQKPDDAIITRKYARHILDDGDPIGKRLTSSSGSILTIRGTMGEPSTKASSQFDLIAPANQGEYADWSRVGFCIIRLANGTDLKKYNEKISRPQSLMCYSHSPIQYGLTPLKGLYFNRIVGPLGTPFLRGSINHVTILTVVACMLLLVGAFNLINIYTVIVLRRTREFSVKKVYGTNDFQIFTQIYVENIYMVATTLLIIWMLIETSAGIFASVYAIPVEPDIAFDLSLSLVLLFVLPLVTSVFPFLHYNYSSPITSLRSIDAGGSSIVSRIVFLSVQYIIMFSLTVVALFFVHQLYTMLNANLGYQAKNIISCQFLSFETQNRRYASDEKWQKEHGLERHKVRVIRQKVDACPLFISWGYGKAPISLEPCVSVESNGKKHKMAIMYVNNNYMNMFGPKLKEGRTWNDKNQFAQYKMMVDEIAKKLFRIKDTNEASLQTESRLWWSVGTDENKNPAYRVVGVIENFRTGHLSVGDAPLTILYGEGENPTESLMVKIAKGKRKEAIQFLKGLHSEVVGEGEFNYSFVEDGVEKLYDNDERTTRIYVTFVGLAIYVSCLGLFELSLYDIRQRYREVALRKVNGATSKQVTLLLVRKYLSILGAAFVVAIPLVYYITNGYAEDFAVKAPIRAGIFVIGFVLTLLISLDTLFWQVRKAVHVNPVLIMENE